MPSTDELLAELAELNPQDPNLIEALTDVATGAFNDDVDSLIATWVQDHETEISSSVLYDLAKHFDVGEGTKLTGAAREIYEAGGAQGLATDRLASGPDANFDLNRSGALEPDEEKARKAAVDAAAKSRSEATGNPVGAETANLESALGIGLIPDILTKYMGRPIVLGDDPDFDGRVRELITTWNSYNPDRQISDREGLYQVLGNANDPDVQDVMDAVFLGTDPVIDYKIPLANGGSVSVTAQQFDAFQKGGFGKYGELDRVGLTNLVRITDRIGLTKHDGSNAWQMTAALARAKAADTENAVFTQSGYKGPKDPDVQKSVYNANKIASLGLRFKEGRYIYGGNDSLAYIHTLDPTLAAKWANTPDDVSQEEVGRLRQLINNGGFDQQQLSAMGYEALSFEDWANDPARSGNRNGGGGGGRMRPDPVAVRQAARDMWMNLYASEPSEQQLNDLIATVDGSISNAPNSQSVDVEAQLRKGLEANPQYGELYGSRPAGMSEQEWQTQFRAGAASLLGNEAADPNAIRSGMRSGQYQTTLGAVAGSRQAWGNSTFRGRLAQAAQIVAEQT